MKHCACVCLSWGYLVKELLLYNALKKLAIPYRSMVISVWQWIVYLLNPWSVQIKIGNIFLYVYNEGIWEVLIKELLLYDALKRLAIPYRPRNKFISWHD